MTWRDICVSPDGTHHLRNGAPLYAERYQEVLAFHEPGLAPVRHGNEAWHIRVGGAAAYGRRFRRTFGFYENLAAVIAPGGWRHIHPNGADAYTVRFDWCGNFQGGRCAARQFDGSYLHITAEGKPAYDARWWYAGDFRDGTAVVQASDGRSTHVSPRGELVHGVWFLDLDVFHKRCARARDEDGWMHVDRAGRPLYARRFAAVEPFYNGQARIERFDGGLEVIDEAGRLVTRLRPALRSEFAALSGDLVGFWRTQTIYTAVELGLFEALPDSAEKIAAECSLDLARARRLLRALAELRLLVEANGEWRFTDRGRYLKAGHPWTLAGAAREYGRVFPRMWESLPEALRDADWKPPNIFQDVAMDADQAAIHHRMLMSYARHDYAEVPAALELRGDEHLIDAGGGLGGLAEMLAREYPNLRITVLDRPEVIKQASRRRLGDSIRLQSTDIFRPWGIKGDAVVMARVLHDWDNAKAVQLLNHAHQALPKGGRLFVVEMAVPENGMAGSLCDLHLLVVNGGMERTAAEYAALLDEADFNVCAIRRTVALPSVILGVAR